MSATRLTTVVIGFIGATALCTATQAWAQQKYTISKAPDSSSRFLQEQVIEVDDMPGHQLRIYEVRNEYPQRDLAFAGVTVKELISRGLSDYVDGSGPYTAYNVYTLEDGNKVFSRLTGTAQTDHTGGRKSVFVESFVGGTGQFKGMRGRVLGNTERESGAKSMTVGMRGEYWLEQ